MRPTYETDTDLDRELDVATKLSKEWRCDVTKTKKFYPVDYVATRDGRLVSLLEIKTRNYTMDELERFGGFMISAEKLVRARELSEMVRVPFILVLKLFGALGDQGIPSDRTSQGTGGARERGSHQEGETYYRSFYNRERYSGEVRLGGRTDRNDPDDRELVMLFTRNMFSRF